MAQPPLIGKWTTGRLYTIVLKLLFIIFLIISVILVLEYFSSGMDELIGPFASPIILNNLTAAIGFFAFDVVVLASLLLLIAGKFFPRLRLKNRDFRLILPVTVLGLIVGSLAVLTLHGCCEIAYRIALGFPFPFLTLEMALDLSSAVPISSLQPWPLIYGQVWTYMQQNVQQHPDVIYWSVWSILPNLIFYAHLSIIVLLAVRSTQHPLRQRKKSTIQTKARSHTTDDASRTVERTVLLLFAEGKASS